MQGTTYWTDLFVRHFLFQDEQAIDCDDLLFFVRKKHVKGSSRYLPKYEVRTTDVATNQIPYKHGSIVKPRYSIRTKFKTVDIVISFLRNILILFKNM